MIAIQHIQISVEPEHLEVAIAFYTEILGARRIHNPLPNSQVIWVKSGDAEIHIRTEKGIDRHKTRVHAAYIVEDLTPVRAKLAAKSFPIEDQHKIPGFNRFHTIDPGGNRVEVMEREK